MLKPALSAAEEDRLAVLYGYHVLDTPTERAFDDLVQLAAAIAGTPVAAITLIDRDRQWVKASAGGLDLNMPREFSVCGHAILDERDFFEVPDLADDERFHGNGMLEAAALRFYGGSRLQGDDGHALGMLCVLDAQPRRLTEQQRAQLRHLAALAMSCLDMHRRHRQQEWFGQVVQEVAEEVFVLDPATMRIVHANRAALDGMGCTPAQLRRLPAGALTPDAMPPADLVAGEQRVVEGRRQRPDGTSYPAEMRWSVLDTPGGPVIACSAQDISDRKRLERIRDEFTAMVSHELRSPLTAIQGALQLLQAGAAGELPPDARELVGIASGSSEQLRRILGDLLDLDRMGAEGMRFETAPVAAVAALRQVAKTHESALVVRGCRIEVTGDASLYLMADPHRLQQMLGNLVSNAGKYAPPGSTVALHAAADGDAVVLQVTDAGAGIPEEFRERIFQRFAQADQRPASASGGSGLGLSIVKAMAQQMDGAVGYDSRPGRTTFWIRLPRAPGRTA
jgi:PAS domain S-box-containing protein